MYSSLRLGRVGRSLALGRLGPSTNAEMRVLHTMGWRLLEEQTRICSILLVAPPAPAFPQGVLSALSCVCTPTSSCTRPPPAHKSSCHALRASASSLRVARVVGGAAPPPPPSHLRRTGTLVLLRHPSYPLMGLPPSFRLAQSLLPSLPLRCLPCRLL